MSKTLRLQRIKDAPHPEHERLGNQAIYWTPDGYGLAAEAVAEQFVKAGIAQIAEAPVSDPGLLASSGEPAIVPAAEEQPFGQPIEAPRRKGKR